MDRVYKKGLSIILVILMVMGGISGVVGPGGGTAYAASADFAGGDGTASDPYQIATADQLNAVRNHLGPGLYFKQTADIDLSSYGNWEPIGLIDEYSSDYFNGNIDGNGFKITNLKIDRKAVYNGFSGLFAVLSGSITDMKLENVEVKGWAFMGGLVGQSYYGTISNSYATGNVNGDQYVGGLVGANYKGTIKNSYATGSVTGSSYVGGLVGYDANRGGPINNIAAAIVGVTVPVTGAVPVSTITASAEYTSTISWSPTTTEFAGGTAYTATITITPDAVHSLTGIPENFFTVAGAISTTNAAGSGVLTAVFPKTVVPITEAGIAGVTVPVAGATPVMTLPDSAEYTAAIAWTPSDATFAGAASYTATISLTPKPGFTLAGVAKDFFSVAGATTTNAADSGVVTAVFPATAAIPIATGAIAGVTAPVAGATPVTAVTYSPEYTATVSWSPATMLFAPETAYTATITINPKAGYTLTGVPAYFFSVAGAITTNTADSGIVTAEFPATAAAPVTEVPVTIVPITTAGIAGVTAPVTGATPVTTVTYSAEYTATVSWSPVTPLFVGGTVYTATIAITPKAGYSLTGVPANFFTVAGATTTNAADSGIVTAEFPVTASVSTDTETDTGTHTGTGSTFTLPTNIIVTSTNGTLTLPVNQAGEVSFGDAVKISIPSGAAVKELKVSIEKVLDPQNLFMNNEILLSPVYEITKNFPENFSTPVMLNIAFDPTLVKSNQKAAVFYYDEVKKAWVEVAGGKIEGNHIMVEVNHFGKYAVLSVDLTTGLPVAEHVTDITTVMNFSDIAGHWAEVSIKHAVSMGMVKGYLDGTFKPNHTVTRAEFAVMLMNVLKPQGAGTDLTFTDTGTIGAWAQTAVAHAVQAGIITGYGDGGFHPNAEITRAEMAVILAKVLGKSAEVKRTTSFADDKNIPAWAKSSVEFVKQSGIVQGKGDNEFAPQDSATRAEAVTVLLKLLAKME